MLEWPECGFEMVVVEKALKKLKEHVARRAGRMPPRKAIEQMEVFMVEIREDMKAAGLLDPRRG